MFDFILFAKIPTNIKSNSSLIKNNYLRDFMGSLCNKKKKKVEKLFPTISLRSVLITFTTNFLLYLIIFITYRFSMCNVSILIFNYYSSFHRKKIVKSFLFYFTCSLFVVVVISLLKTSRKLFSKLQTIIVSSFCIKLL